MSKPYPKTPLWYLILIIVVMCPALAVQMTGKPTDNPTANALNWLYPAYVIAAGICSYITYPERRAVSWILLVLMVLTHAAMLILNQ